MATETALVVTLAKSDTELIGVTRWSVWAGDHRLAGDTAPTSAFGCVSFVDAPTIDQLETQAFDLADEALASMRKLLRLIRDKGEGSSGALRDFVETGGALGVVVSQLRATADVLETFV